MTPRASAPVKRSSATSRADLFCFARINDPRTLLDLLPRDAVLARGEVIVAMANPQLRLALRSALFRISRLTLCQRCGPSLPALRDGSKTTPRRHHPVPLRQEDRCQGDGRHAPAARRPRLLLQLAST